MVLFFTSTGKSNMLDISFRQLIQHCSIVVSPPALIYMSVASWEQTERNTDLIGLLQGKGQG